MYYENQQTYLEKRMPLACFKHGDRKAYILTTDSISKLNKKFKINLWSEYDVTLNIFADGYANLMKMKYSYADEEFVETEVLELTPEMLKDIQLVKE